MRKIVVLAGSIATLLAAAHLHAQSQFYDAREMAMLPPYCKFVAGAPQGQGSDDLAERKRWETILGEMITHMHHWCRGLAQTNRALYGTNSQPERMRILSGAIGEIDYVVKKSPRNFVLLPEFLYRKGENLIRVGRSSEGTVALQGAIELKPDYWPPYAAMSDFFKGAGDVPKAREWLDKALAIDPNAKALKFRQAELGGSKGVAPTEAAQRPAPRPAKPPAPPPQAETLPPAKREPESESEPTAK